MCRPLEVRSRSAGVVRLRAAAGAQLREPLTLEHVKSRLLGHSGTAPGLSFIYAHVNRLIRARDLSVMCVTGPGHGGPGLVANTYLEGTYSEIHPRIGGNTEGLRRLSRHLSFPGAPATPPPRRPVQSTRAANATTRCCTPEPPLTVPTCRRAA
jgi:phosphoketolase